MDQIIVNPFSFSGLLSSILTIALIGGLWHYKFPVTIVYEKLIPLIVASAGFGYLLGIILFIKGGKAAVPGLNPKAVTGSLLHQLVVGREINPILFGKLNVKVWIMRILCNGIVSFTFSFTCNIKFKSNTIDLIGNVIIFSDCFTRTAGFEGF